MATSKETDRTGSVGSQWGRIGWGTGIVFAPLLAAFHAGCLARSADAAGILVSLLGVALGSLCADGVTGLVHWGCDTWGSERTRGLGPGLIRSFREHHRYPRQMLTHDWIEVNREPALAAILALALACLPSIRQLLESEPLLYGVFIGLASVGGAANQLHLWAHRADRPRLVRHLQRWRVILPRERHARHHRADHTAAYCIATGWLNPILDRTGFWRALERGIEGVTGARPRTARGQELLGSRRLGGPGPPRAALGLQRGVAPMQE